MPVLEVKYVYYTPRGTAGVTLHPYQKKLPGYPVAGGLIEGIEGQGSPNDRVPHSMNDTIIRISGT